MYAHIKYIGGGAYMPIGHWHVSFKTICQTCLLVYQFRARRKLILRTNHYSCCYQMSELCDKFYFIQCLYMLQKTSSSIEGKRTVTSLKWNFESLKSNLLLVKWYHQMWFSHDLNQILIWICPSLNALITTETEVSVEVGLIGAGCISRGSLCLQGSSTDSQHMNAAQRAALQVRFMQQ